MCTTPYALLPQIGFTPPPGAHYGLGADHHHLTAIKRVADGFSVSVEVHHALYDTRPTNLRRDEVLAWFGGPAQVEAAHRRSDDDHRLTPLFLEDFD